MYFAQPGWLALLILLPLLVVAAVLCLRLKRRQWTEFVAPRLRPTLLKRGPALPRWLALAFLLLACAAAIVALARPRADAGVKTEKTVGRNVMIALDISKSMRVSDVKPDRLTQAKVVIYELLEAMPSERIGFIAFAGNAHTYAPLTIDHTAVRETVEQIDPDWAPLGGSDLASAVKLATETLKKTGQKNNALVILSDGERQGDGFDAMVAEAERSGVYIIAIGVGTESGDFVPNADFPDGRMVDRGGRAVISRLQVSGLRKLAEETHGRFAIAGSGMDIPAMVQSVVKDLDAFEMDGRDRRISVEFYQWLMAPAVAFLMISIAAASRWRGVAVAVLLGAVSLTPQPARASEATEAMAALSAKRNDEARDAYHRLADSARSGETRARYRLGEGTAAYRAGDFRHARTAFSGALLSGDPAVEAGGHRGIANSLFQLGWKGLTGEAYPTASGTLPDLDQFDAKVKDALAKQGEADAPPAGETDVFSVFEALITNWTDAVRHFDSTLKLEPSDKVARKNRDLTMIYLNRLQELLQQEKQETEDSMPQQGQPGEGQPQEGEEGDEGEGSGESQQGKNGKNGRQGKGGDRDPKDGRGGDKDNDPKDGKGGERPKKNDDNKTKGDRGENPNESPEERSRRILKENADLEKGPLSPGRREFRDAEQDW